MCATSRFTRSSITLVALLFAAVPRPALAGLVDAAPALRLLHREDFKDATLADWVVEQLPGGKVAAGGGVLSIEDKEGCTVWLKQRLETPIRIRYSVTIVNRGGPFDRVSDLNCFWLASDPRAPLDFFRSGHGRTGRFSTYDHLLTYYVGCGGNENTTTRFRRYSGDGARPLLPEHDLREREFLLEGNRCYAIEIVADGSRVVFRRDGRVLFDWKDEKPLSAGWFGFRTVQSHLEIRDFIVDRP
jgi:hypothetical protein